MYYYLLNCVWKWITWAMNHFTNKPVSQGSFFFYCEMSKMTRMMKVEKIEKGWLRRFYRENFLSSDKFSPFLEEKFIFTQPYQHYKSARERTFLREWRCLMWSNSAVWWYGMGDEWLTLRRRKILCKVTECMIHENVGNWIGNKDQWYTK